MLLRHAVSLEVGFQFSDICDGIYTLLKDGHKSSLIKFILMMLHHSFCLILFPMNLYYSTDPIFPKLILILYFVPAISKALSLYATTYSNGTTFPEIASMYYLNVLAGILNIYSRNIHYFIIMYQFIDFLNGQEELK